MQILFVACLNKRTMESPIPLYENMVFASNLLAPRTVMRFPLFNSYRRHCAHHALRSEFKQDAAMM